MVVVNNTVPPQLVTTTGSTIGRLLPGQGHLLHYLVTATGGTIGRLKPGQGHLLRLATARTQSSILKSHFHIVCKLNQHAARSLISQRVAANSTPLVVVPLTG